MDCKAFRTRCEEPCKPCKRRRTDCRSLRRGYKGLCTAYKSLRTARKGLRTDCSEHCIPYRTRRKQETTRRKDVNGSSWPHIACRIHDRARKKYGHS